MCKDCFELAGSPEIITDKTKNASTLVDELYDTEDGGVGGYGHIVFDDWNLEDSHIEACLKSAIEKEYDWLCEETRLASIKALEFFKSMTLNERYSAMAINSNFIKTK